MEKIRLLGITLLVMTSQAMTSRAFAADMEPEPLLTVAPQPVTDWLTLDGTVSAINQGRWRPRPAAGSPACWWM